MAGTHFTERWLLVNAPLAAFLEFEMLHCVGEINVRAWDARLAQCAIQQPASRSHERTASQILFIARLLADQDQVRTPWTFPKDRLGRMQVEIAPLAGSHRLIEQGNGCVLRYVLFGAGPPGGCHPYTHRQFSNHRAALPV